MTDAALKHDTFVLNRTFPHPPDKVFSAFSDPAAKARWYAQGGAHEVVRYDLDFTKDGQELLVGRMGLHTPVAGQTIVWTQTFAEIVEDRRIVCTQTVDMGERRISCAVITFQFAATESGCALTLTHQAVFLEPSDGPEMRRIGWMALLDALAGSLRQP